MLWYYAGEGTTTTSNFVVVSSSCSTGCPYLPCYNWGCPRAGTTGPYNHNEPIYAYVELTPEKEAEILRLPDWLLELRRTPRRTKRGLPALREAPESAADLAGHAAPYLHPKANHGAPHGREEGMRMKPSRELFSTTSLVKPPEPRIEAITSTTTSSAPPDLYAVAEVIEEGWYRRGIYVSKTDFIF